MSLFMFGGGGYEDFKKNNKITEDNNDTFDEFVTEILTGGKETTEEKPYVEALKALSEDKINMYYQLIKDVGTLLGMTETFSEPSAIQLSKMDHAVQDKLDLFSAFYKLGEGCNSEIDRIKRNAVTELDELGEAKDTLSLEDNSDTHEFCRDVKAYKLGIDVGRWPNKALAGEIITKIIKITTKNPSFYERITLIKQHFPKKELCNAFKDAEYRLKRIFGDYIFPEEKSPDDDKLIAYQKQERKEYMDFAYKYMALFALQEISRQVLELLKETEQIDDDRDKDEGWRCMMGQGRFAGKYQELMGRINRDTVARTVCLGETYAVACACPRQIEKIETKQRESKIITYKLGVADKRWWKICERVYDNQEVADKMRYAVCALIFCYMPVKDEYTISKLPSDKFKETLNNIRKEPEKYDKNDPKMKQRIDQLSQLQVVIKSKIVLDEMINVDKFTAIAYDLFSRKYPENTLEYCRITLDNYKVSINTIIARYNKEQLKDFPIEYKYSKLIQTYVTQKGDLEPIRMSDPVDMKLNTFEKKQTGGRRSRNRRRYISRTRRL